MKLDGFHLPALSRLSTTVWTYDGGDGEAAELRVPHLSVDLLDRQIDALIEARTEVLAERPVERIVEAVDAVAHRFLDPSDAIRRCAEVGLAAVTGLSRPMVGLILDGMARDWRGDELRRLLATDLGDPAALDGFVQRRNAPGRVRAYGPDLVVHIFSGNVPGVSVTSLIRAMLVKSASLGKTAAGEPVLAPLFARALAGVDPELGRCLAVIYWPGGDEALEATALGRAGAVIGYGGREATTALRARTPAETLFLGYGHKLSFGVVAREAVAGTGERGVAADAALAVATFDQQGCVSPHLFYVEGDDDAAARSFARALANEMRTLESHMPRGVLAPGEAAAIRQLRGEIEFARIAGRGHELIASPSGTAWTVVFDPEPGFTPSCLNRVVRVKPVRRLEEVVEHARPLGRLLQTVGVAGPEARLAPLVEALGRLGASRVAPIAAMAWPSPWWHHDGRPPLADLVRWCDWDEDPRATVGSTAEGAR
jgi:hypothetical protein